MTDHSPIQDDRLELEEGLPQEVTEDEVYQLASVIQQQTEWAIEKDLDITTQQEHEFRQIMQKANNLKEERQESIERELALAESQVSLMEACNE